MTAGLAAELCQSTTKPTASGKEFPCSQHASCTLFGVHLCGGHANMWKDRVARGQRIRIHPERALPIEHVCTLPPAGAPVPANSKRCSRCKKVKPLDAFALASRSPDGHHWWCVECSRAYHREHYERDRAARNATRGGNTEARTGRAPAALASVELTPTGMSPATEALAFPGWACSHSPDQYGGKRCVSCCTTRSLTYVELVAAGGTPARRRWLCHDCLAQYRARGHVAGELHGAGWSEAAA